MRSSTLLPVCFFSITVLHAQIPNASFEEWENSSGTWEPVGWRTLNFMSIGDLPAQQGTPGVDGEYYIRLSTVAGHLGAVSNSLAFTAGAVDEPDGFPHTVRSARLEGSHRFLPVGTDQGRITVALYRWDAGLGMRVAVGGGVLALTDESPEWSSFEIPIVYFDPLDPDTAFISLLSGASGSSQVGTILDIDDLEFQGLSTEVATHSNAMEIGVFPSPAADRLNWSADRAAGPLRWRIITLDGHVADEGNREGAAGPIDVHALPTGIYVLHAMDEAGRSGHSRFAKE